MHNNKKFIKKNTKNKSKHKLKRENSKIKPKFVNYKWLKITPKEVYQYNKFYKKKWKKIQKQIKKFVQKVEIKTT